MLELPLLALDNRARTRTGDSLGLIGRVKLYGKQ